MNWGRSRQREGFCSLFDTLDPKGPAFSARTEAQILNRACPYCARTNTATANPHLDLLHMVVAMPYQRGQRLQLTEMLIFYDSH